MHPLKKTQGGALLTALFIMTLVAIVATAMSTRMQLDIYRTRLVITHDKLYLASQAVTFWAMTELNNKNLKFTKLNAQGMVDKYPKTLETIYNQVKLEGGLYDLQARFNLNNLSEKKSVPTFISLMKQINLKADDAEKVNLTQSIKDWISPYDIAKGKDAYAAYYLSQRPPYNPSHQLIQSSSELRLIKGVDAATYLSLEPFITVLSDESLTPININTAAKPILMSLGNGLSSAQVNELIKARGESGIKDLKDINELLTKLDLPNDQITIESNYFLNVAHASSDEFNVVVYTLLKRSRDKKGKITVSVIRESINNF
jgi:general secretion pathway protein K